jgi:hypothetical protein
MSYYIYLHLIAKNGNSTHSIQPTVHCYRMMKIKVSLHLKTEQQFQQIYLGVNVCLNLSHFFHWTVGWVSPSTGLDTRTKTKLCHRQGTIPIPAGRSLVTTRSKLPAFLFTDVKTVGVTHLFRIQLSRHPSIV